MALGRTCLLLLPLLGASLASAQPASPPIPPKPASNPEIIQVLATLPSPLVCREGDEDGEPLEKPEMAGLEQGLDKPIPWEKLSPEHREAIAAIIQRPALNCYGPVETFLAKPNYYSWLLDHPDATTVLWQKLGAKCLPIQSTGENSFRWRDPDHGQISWTMVHKDPEMRIWLASGRVRPTKLMPTSNVEAVLVARYQTGKTSQDRPAVRHQYQLFLRTDSRATAMAARFLGASVPKLAEQYMAQLQLFFHGMAWLDEEQPRRSQRLVEGVVPPEILRPVVSKTDKTQATTVAKPILADPADQP